ncbi:hypothetical protein GF327_00285 [Candidatus Woesearchaeota archaeon]|nr:hypothetical protein [Candidatus Woesearchaeota archaeon]
MKKVILDTNFLLIPYVFKVDIFNEIKRLINDKYELLIMQGTIDELDNIIKRQKKKHKRAANMALDLIKKKRIKIINQELIEIDKQKSLNTRSNSKKVINVDKAILEIADKNTIVATQDQKLKNKLRKKRIKLIVLRNKQYLKLI